MCCNATKCNVLQVRVLGNQYRLLGGVLVSVSLIDAHRHTRTNKRAHMSSTMYLFPFQFSKLVTQQVVLSMGVVFGLLFGYIRVSHVDRQCKGEHISEPSCLTVVSSFVLQTKVQEVVESLQRKSVL